MGPGQIFMDEFDVEEGAWKKMEMELEIDGIVRGRNREDCKIYESYVGRVLATVVACCSYLREISKGVTKFTNGWPKIIF
jgi:hypothetical protein